MSSLSDMLRQFARRFGRPGHSVTIDMHQHQDGRDDEFDERITAVEKEQRDMRLELLEMQSDPRGHLRHD